MLKPRNQPFWRYFVTSAIAHFLTFFLIWELSHPGEAEPQAPSFMVQIEDARGRRARDGGRDRSGVPAKSRILNLGLAPQPSLQSNAPSGEDREGRLTGAGDWSGANDGFEVASQMKVEQEATLYPFFNSLWRKVEAVTTYPSDLARQRIQGTAQIQLEVDHRGVFTGDIREVRGEEPMLNALSAAILVHALSEPLPENLWMKDESGRLRNSMILVFRFDYRFFLPGESPRKIDIAHFKNVLAFRRDAYVEPRANDVIDEIFTRYVPPIIPVPGGFAIDLFRAVQYVKNMVENPPDEGELRARRLRFMKERWEQVVRKRELSEAHR